MASATILSVVTKPASDPTAGAWPDGGALGYWYKTQSSLAAVGADASLPPIVTSCAWATPSGIGTRTEAANSLATMALPPALGGGRMIYTWGDIALGGGKILLTTTAPVVVSLCCYSQLVADPRLSILDAGTSAVLDSVSQPNTAVPPTTWYRIRVDGAVAIRFDSTAWRVCGVIFSPVTASYSDPGLGGLAIGGEWPASLAIGLAAPIGLAIGIGEGMDPTATLVEAAGAGLALGGDWPASLAIGLDAPGGLAIGGGWTAASASDPTTLRAAIFARLKSSTALAAVVGPRIHHGRIPQRGEWPAVVFHAPARSYGHNLGGGDGTSTATVQVDCWGTSPDQCEAAATAVRLAFQGFRGPIGTVRFLGVFVDDVGETAERDPPGSDVWSYRHIITLEARHRVSIPTS